MLSEGYTYLRKPRSINSKPTDEFIYITNVTKAIYSPLQLNGSSHKHLQL